jgi:hypothetical protein
MFIDFANKQSRFMSGDLGIRIFKQSGPYRRRCPPKATEKSHFFSDDTLEKNRFTSAFFFFYEKDKE